VQTIFWGQPADEVGVLPDPCGGGALYGFEVYLIGVGTRSDPALKGFLVIKKKKRSYFEYSRKQVKQNPVMRSAKRDWDSSIKHN
jgi:hypothetical protein